MQVEVTNYKNDTGESRYSPRPTPGFLSSMQ